jgi:hypothetical protein
MLPENNQNLNQLHKQSNKNSKILLVVLSVIILGIGAYYFLMNSKVNLSSHKYQSAEYGFYYDGPQNHSENNSKTETDGATTSTLFMFNPYDGTNDHLTIMRTIEGEEEVVNEMIDYLVSGAPYEGKRVVNGIEFDQYGGDNGQATYIVSKGNITYFIVMFDPEDINHFGFIN